MLQKWNTWKVAHVFFDEPTGAHGLREVSRKAKIAPPSVKRILSALCDEGIVRKEIERQASRRIPTYRADYDTQPYRLHKTMDMLLRLQPVVRDIQAELTPDCIVLFGSASRGEDVERSDIDLFVQASRTVDLSRHERALKRKIQLHVREDVRGYPRELVANIANGIVLAGYLDVA